MVGMPAARITDMHVCPMVTGIVPHVGGPIAGPCSPNVLTGNLLQARVTDMCVCAGPPDVIVTGSATVLVNGLMAARMLDTTAHGGKIIFGWPTVLIGGAAGGAAGGGGAGGMVGPIAGSAPRQAGVPGAAVQVPPDMLKKSPTLAKQLDDLKKDGWTIEYGEPGGGSFCDKDAKKITVDPNDAKNDGTLTQTVAHEVGHAKYTGEPDMSSKSAFLDSQLADEGAATMNNVKVQREINANGGPDIGIAGNPENGPKYDKIMDNYEKDGDDAKARTEIGRVFGDGERTSNTGQTYNEYYGSWYDENYPADSP